MSVEFIGMIGTQPASEIHPPRGPAIDIDYVRRFAQAHEQADFDRILIGYFSNAADGFLVAMYAASVTEKLCLMLAHRMPRSRSQESTPTVMRYEVSPWPRRPRPSRKCASAARHERTVRFSLSTR